MRRERQTQRQTQFVAIGRRQRRYARDRRIIDMEEPKPMWFCLKCGCVAMDWGAEDPIGNLGTTVTVDDSAIGFLCKGCFAKSQETGRLEVADPAMN
jgi:hypothetical protein